MIQISRIPKSKVNIWTLSIRTYSTNKNSLPPLPETFTTTTKPKTTTTKQTQISKAPSNPSPFYRPEPPLVAAARAKNVSQRSVWESYLVLDPKVRLYFSLGLMVFAGIGLYAGDYLVPQTEEEKEISELAK